MQSTIHSIILSVSLITILIVGIKAYIFSKNYKDELEEKYKHLPKVDVTSETALLAIQNNLPELLRKIKKAKVISSK